MSELMGVATGLRPKDMANIGDTYYPAGLPEGDDVDVLEWRADFVDPEGKPFIIVYTRKQVLDIRKQCGVFAPYMPLLISPPVPLAPPTPSEEARNLLRSAHEVAKRKGEETNWEAFELSLRRVLLRLGGVDPDTKDEQIILRATCTPRTYRLPPDEK